MNWYKTESWEPFLKDLHKKKANAEKKGDELGHVLNAWTPMNSCVCRKCGAYAKINGLYGSDEKVSFYGAAFTNPCNINFDTEPEFEDFTNPNPQNAVL